MQKWEYRFVADSSIDTSQVEAMTRMLNEYGVDGWELVNFHYQFHPGFQNVNADSESIMLVFKRPKS